MPNIVPENGNTTRGIVAKTVTGLTGLSKIADKIEDTNLKLALNDQVSQLTDALNTVLSLQVRNSQLEEKLAEKSKYRLKETKLGRFIYVLKDEPQIEEPPHAVCPDCFKDGNIRILQRGFQPPRQRGKSGLNLLKCQCKFSCALDQEELASVYE